MNQSDEQVQKLMKWLIKGALSYEDGRYEEQ